MTNSSGHIKSYYAHSCAFAPICPPLRGSIKTKTLVIGGGLAGLTCARELARAGQEVVLLEAHRLGYGASGRNGGFVSSGFAQGMDDIIAHVGEERARQLFDLSVMGVNYVRDTLMDLGASHLIQGEGGINLIRHGDGAEFQEKSKRYQRLFGKSLVYWDRQKVQNSIHSSVYQAGLYDASAFHIHPLAYVQALGEQAQAQGAIFYENSPVKALQRIGKHWRVICDKGAVEAEHIVMATSAYGHFFKPVQRALVPVATYVIASRPLGRMLEGVIEFSGTISDTRRAGDYYRIIGQGEERRLIWGGRITTRRSEPSQLAHLLKNDIVEIFPQLYDLSVEYAWSGLMGYTRHKMPLIGPLWHEKYPNIWALTGFGGHGLNTTAMGGLLIADAIANSDERWRFFQPFKPAWTGGWVGRIAAQTQYWHMQWQDRKEEKTRIK